MWRAESEGIAFGQDAGLHQLIALIWFLVTLVLLFVTWGYGWCTTTSLFFSLAFSVFWYVIPGHGIVYGPILLYAIIDAIWGRKK